MYMTCMCMCMYVCICARVFLRRLLSLEWCVADIWFKSSSHDRWDAQFIIYMCSVFVTLLDLPRRNSIFLSPPLSLSLSCPKLPRAARFAINLNYYYYRYYVHVERLVPRGESRLFSKSQLKLGRSLAQSGENVIFCIFSYVTTIREMKKLS